MIPFPVSETEYSLFVVLENDNLERMHAYDPAEVVPAKLTLPGNRSLRDIVIGLATPSDVAKVFELFKADKKFEALRWLSRGYRYRVETGEAGDNELPGFLKG